MSIDDTGSVNQTDFATITCTMLQSSRRVFGNACSFPTDGDFFRRSRNSSTISADDDHRV